MSTRTRAVMTQQEWDALSPEAQEERREYLSTIGKARWAKRKAVTTEIRNAQADAMWRRGELQCAELKALELIISSWTYHPPTDDDWRTWTGALRWAALMVRYWHTCWTEGKFNQGLGPFYCPPCGDAHQAGWTAQLCLDCWWQDSGYDEALTLARKVGRQWTQNQKGRAA